MSAPAIQFGRVINVTELVDNASFTTLHWRAFVLCVVCLVTDGFDVQALGYTAPSIIRDWDVPNAVLGPVFAAANFGVLIGALLFSMLADRIGRRPVIVAAMLFIGVTTLLTARTATVPQLLLMRLLAGIGLGAILSNASALVAEYSPKRLRARMIMYSGIGFTSGAALGGFVAAALIPSYGWESVFVFGGLLPIVIGGAMLAALPESLQFLAMRGKHSDQLARWLNRVDRTLHASVSDEFVAAEENNAGVPIVHLFRGGRATPTILFWVVNFMNLLTLYSLASWIPTVVRDSGYSVQTGVLVGSTLQVGGTLGTFAFASLIARAGFVRIMSGTFLIGAVGVACIGQPGISLEMLYMLVFGAGCCIVGNQAGLNALSGAYYPTFIRSTGVGAGLGVGRIGSIVGPAIGGMFMAAHWTARDIFLAAAIPVVISALAMFSLRFVIGTRLGRASATN